MKKARKVKSQKRIVIERNIELGILWSSTALWSLLGLIFTWVYFKTGVTHAEVVLAIRYQVIALSVAISMCPLVPFPYWFRLIVFGLGLVMLEVGA
jgi:hypothetical protein